MMQAAENGEYTNGLFSDQSDLARGIDTDNHDIYSLKKTRLEHYRIRGIVLKWFTNYLKNRK